ncbi:uncharacterized protein LOC126094789 isoform X1 [Schistocerca cancellata]|uniref:uncharacterized protein LOC126094789 isoform X1 n=1 Tax=Schistocerca cancellata TaxID=274614 RepID=UPI0021176997|nr:uncharacterized protein LOC126094789 isoform X1 [Schistocerca cancellata]
MQYVKGHENLIVMGDWNAVLGEGVEEKVTGEYGLGTRNERGERLIEFCNKFQLVIANTLFKNHKRRRYTWKRPGDTGRFQLDYIMIRQRFRNQILDCKAYPGADIDSDHNIVVMRSRLKFKTLVRKNQYAKKWDTEVLRNDEIRLKFSNAIDTAIRNSAVGSTVEEKWTWLKKAITEVGKENISTKKVAAKKPWVTEEILQLIDERRKYKHVPGKSGIQKYKSLRNEINRKCREAKTKWLQEKCEDIEKDMIVRRTDSAHRKVKTTFGDIKSNGGNIKSATGIPLLNAEERAGRWKEYIESLYEGEDLSDVIEEETGVDLEEIGDPVLESEFKRALED